MRINKKVVIIAAAAVVVAAAAIIIGVNVSGRDKFKNGTTINGISVSRMTADEASDALNAAYADYMLNVTIGDDFSYSASSSDISMALSANVDLQDMIDNQSFGSSKQLTVDELYTMDLSAFHTAIEEYSEASNLQEAENAHIVFDEEADEFVAEEGHAGYELNADDISLEVQDKVQTLKEDIKYDLDDFYVTDPDLTVDSDEVQEALDAANEYKDMTITVSFTPDNSSTTYEEIDWELIKGWLQVDYDGLNLVINDTELSSYVSDIASEHTISTGTSQFKTHSGSYITVAASTAGQSVNSTGLYDVLYENLTEKKGGTVVAPYDTATQAEPITDFGGTYVELDLTRQMCYLYVNGSCVLSAPTVSGNVSAGMTTPGGVFHIYAKQTNRYLTGPGYRSFVNYWMPFNGGIGLHDGTWRSTFGGTEYLYNGSHGCVNLPLSAAATVFSNVRVGTTVVVYGGATSVSYQNQIFNLSNTSFDLSCGQNATLSVDCITTPTFTSSNDAVATVDSSGNIHAVGAGTCTIHVTAPQEAAYLQADGDVTVTVSHSYDGGSVTSAATCTSAGVRTRTCSGCHATITESIPALGHTTSNGTCSRCHQVIGHPETSAPETETQAPETETQAPETQAPEESSSSEG